MFETALRMLKPVFFQQLPEDPGGIGRHVAAGKKFFTVMKLVPLFLVPPVDAGYIPAKNAALADLVAEALLKPVPQDPLLKIFRFFSGAPAVSHPDGSQGADYRPADLAGCAQPAPECAHRPHQLRCDFTLQFFLPDRKNGLASLESL